jgi:hypothetical protein
MDLPPSGWYPDPYGVPGLLRWWDGSTWTQHTQQDETDAPAGPEPATTIQPTTAQPAIRPTTVQPAIPPTTAQPAIPPAVQPTAVQPPVPPAAYPADAYPAGTPGVPPAAVQPDTGQPPRGADADGTQVLFLGDDAWAASGPPDSAPPGGGYGYYRARRRRRMWLLSGLAGGTAVALGVIALVVSTLSKSPATPTAATAPATPAAHATTPPSSPAPSASPSATAPGSVLTDSQSGLSYAQLGSPWQPSCPSGLNGGGFTWTAGESAVAGQVNGGQSTWYGVACSAPLPQQYGYSGVADLENVATNVVNTFSGYYGMLQNNTAQQLSQPVQVSGHAGWEIKFLVTYTNPQGQGLSWSDELGAVVVTDLGSGVAPAVFYTSIPGNLGEKNVDSLVSSLQVSAPQQAGGGGSPAAGSSAP